MHSAHNKIEGIRRIVSSKSSICQENGFFRESIGSTQIGKKTKNHHHATIAPTPTPVSYLIAQPGRDCSIMAQPATLTGSILASASGAISSTAPTQSDDDKRYYTLRATVSNATIAFAERPTRTALTVLTHYFVDEFPDLFETSNPNGAITFVSDDTASSSAAAA